MTTSWLDGKHVVFGKVTDGMDVVKAIEKTPTAAGDKPKKAVVIASCREVVADAADDNKEL